MTDAKSSESNNHSVSKSYKRKTWLEHEYWVKNRSMEDIAKSQGVTNPTILYWMRKYNIPRRDNGTAITMAADERLLDEDWLYDMYIKNRKTIREIADECDAGKTAVHNALERADIDIRIMAEYGRWVDHSVNSDADN